MKFKIISIALALSLILTGCSLFGNSSASETVAAVETTPVATQTAKDGQTEYIFPQSFTWFIGKPELNNIGEGGSSTGAYEISGDYADTAYVTGGKLHLFSNSTQVQALIALNDSFLEQAVNDWLELNPEYQYERSDNYSKLVFYMDEVLSDSDVSDREYEINLMLTILYIDHANNILANTNNDTSTEVQIINYHTSNIAYDISYPSQSFDYSSIDWDASY